MSRALLLLLALAAAPALAEEEIDKGKLVLLPSTQRILKVPGMKRVAYGNPNVAEVKGIGGDQILITAVDLGMTTLLVWTAEARFSYVVQVCWHCGDSEEVAALKRLLGEPEGITVRRIGDRYYLEGQAYTDEELERVARVQWAFPEVVSLVKRAPHIVKRAAERANEALKKAGYADAHVTPIAGTLFLEGQVESEADRQRAERIVQAATSSD